MVTLSPKARALVRTARRMDDPTEEDARRIRASVLAKVGAAALGAAVVTSKSAQAFAKLSSLLATTAGKIGATAAVVGALSGGTYVVHAVRSAHVPAVVVPAPAAAKTPARVVNQDDTGQARDAHADGLESIPPLPLPAPQSPPSSMRAAHRKQVLANAKSPPPNPAAATRGILDLEGEVRLLEDADAALRRGDTDTALTRLADHAAKYPSGTLSHEREGVRAIALCRAGRLAEGKNAADAFLSAMQNSSLGSRIRTACGMNRKGR